MAIADTPYSDNIQSHQREAEIIARKQERLHILRKQQATCGISTAPHIEMEIAQLEQELEALASIHLQQKRELQTEQLCSPISQYDEFFRLLFGESVRWDGEKKYFLQRLLNNITYACKADGALITRFNGIDWEITESSYGSEHKSKDEFLQQLLSRTLTLANEPLYRNPFTLNNTLKGVHPNGKIYTCTIFPDSTPYKALIIYGIRNPLQLDITYITIINTLLSATANLTTARSVEELETTVYNALKRQFQYVSDYVYHRQFELFTNRLKQMIVYFEPIISLSRKPYISRWEALARDPSAAPMRAPTDLFAIAELWGRMFQLELDEHFLKIAIASYYSSNKKSSPAIARGELPALSVNIYPESLVRRSFQKIIAQIEDERIFPLDKLVFEISEKLPLPMPDKADGANDPIGWFREKLRFFTDLGISFAIDDFGVGYASTSRLSRLEPEFVKVDRDALLHQLGGFTLEYARNLVSGSLGKMKMIVEGFDDQSRFTLAQLYDLKIRYVQGHLLGRAQEQIYQLSPEDEVRIVALLQR